MFYVTNIPFHGFSKVGARHLENNNIDNDIRFAYFRVKKIFEYT